MRRAVARTALATATALAMIAGPLAAQSGADDTGRGVGGGAGAIYIVESGDTFQAVARKLGVDMKALGEANGIPPPYVIRVGQQIRRPAQAAPRMSPSPTPGTRPAPRPSPSARPPLPARPVPQPAPAHQREQGAPVLAWPTSGAVVSRFGVPVAGRPNNGIDLAAFAGMPVRAAAPGKVIFAGTEPERFGQLVLIDHGGGWVTAYAYLGRVLVREGQAVRVHQQIAAIGSSGEAKRPTLHFELRRGNVPRDPQVYLPVRL